MEEMDTDTIGLIVGIAAVLAVVVAGKWQTRKAEADAPQRAISSSVAPLPWLSQLAKPPRLQAKEQRPGHDRFTPGMANAGRE